MEQVYTLRTLALKALLKGGLEPEICYDILGALLRFKIDLVIHNDMYIIL